VLATRSHRATSHTNTQTHDMIHTGGKRNIWTKIIFNYDMLTSVDKSCLHSWPAGTLTPSMFFFNIRRVQHSKKHVRKAHNALCSDIYLRVAICSVHLLPIDGRSVNTPYHKRWQVSVGSTVKWRHAPNGCGAVEICVGVWRQGKVKRIQIFHKL